MKLHPIFFRPLFGGLTAALLLCGSALQARSDVRISEFMAVNDSVLQDEDLEYSDWIELYNAGGSTVDLSGWHLTDSKSDLVKWTFPATNLPAGGFLLVYASGKDKTATNLHANFSLSSSGEYLALVHPDGTNVEDEVRGVPDQFPDISYGIQTHGSNPTLRAGLAGYLIEHTPGSANTCLPANHPIYSDDSVARIDLMMADSTWDWLNNTPDKSSFRSVDVRFRHGDIDLTVTNAGIQCRGNTSLYSKPRSFNVIFNAYVPGQKLLDLERLNLNANVNDPSTARPKLVGDLHQAANLPISYANHVAVIVSKTNSHSVVFDALRNNTQPVDDVLLEQRFGTDRGNLYKCLYVGGSTDYAASLTNAHHFGTSYNLTYSGNGDESYADLTDFIHLINDTSNADFPNAIMQTFDVDGFLKRMALDVLTGNWDSYWGNANNYYLFYDTDTLQWTYIPYDFDNVIGISWDNGNINWSTCDIYNWPQLFDNTPLAERILEVPAFSNRYSFYMKEMLDDFYTNDQITPSVFHTRSTLTNALPFDTDSVNNMKEEDRNNYSGYDPEWSYTDFWESYAKGRWFNTDIQYYGYRDYGITNYTQIRRDTALSQLGTISNIAPVLSEFKMKPSLPRTNDAIEVSIEALDDSTVTNVSFIYSFDGGTTQTVEMALQTDGSFETNLSAFGSNGTLIYYVRATDDNGQSTTHPFGGSDYAASVEIESDAFNILFSEINYHPLDPSAAEIAAGFTDDDYFEFVEISNIGDSPMDLTGFTIQDGITAILPSVSLTNGEYAVVVADTQAFRARYTNTAIRILCVFDGKLSNSGETIRIEDPQGGKVVSISYSDGGSWPGRADGDGSSLEVEDVLLDTTESSNWRSSSEVGGTPGTTGTGPDNRVVINEILSHTDAPLCDSIELFNTTDAAIDISGWALSDATTNYTKYVISNGTVLAAASYIVFNETNHFNTSLGVDSNDFALDGAHGDDVFLMETDGAGNPLRFVDRVEFGAAANGESFGRWPNGSGRVVPMISRTFNASNSGPRVGPLLINEIMYNHSTSNDSLEFVEILNPTAMPVDLTRWEIDGGVDYTFPSNTTLAASETVVIIPFNPDNPSNSTRLATFRSTYGLSTNVPLLGGYSGWLDNGGERLRLLRPDEPPIEEPTFYPMLLEDETKYDDDAPWPLTADAGGASLSRQGTIGWGDDFTSWAAATPPNPGSNPPPQPTHDLIVFSTHGSPIPPAGSNAIVADTTFTNSVEASDIQGGSRFFCTGWTMEGNDPLSGATNFFSITLTNNASLRWHWDTNYLLAVSADIGGEVLPEAGWQLPGTIVELTATASNGYLFTGWSGNTQAITSGTATSSLISVKMDFSVSLTANFVSNVPTYYASPTGSHTPPYTNWTMASISLQTLVDYVPVNSTVLVAAATWPLSSQLTLGKAVHLRSADGPATTFLDGGNSTRILHLSHADAIVEGFTLQNGNSWGNSGGGVRIDPDGLLTHCIVRGNTTQNKGGGCAIIFDGEVRNCLFYDNSAALLGGGIYTFTESGSPLLQSCTVSENDADQGGGGLYLLNDATLQNSIAWGNTSQYGNSNIYLDNSGHTIVFTDSGPAQSGTANTGADPSFADAAANNFRLSPDSPLINAGAGQSWMTGAVDLDGAARLIYGTNDIGAFEGLSAAVDSDSDSICDWQESQAGTDPFSASSVLGIQTAEKGMVLGQFILNWSSATGRSYRIAFATNMLPPAVFDSLAYSNIPSTPPANTFTGVLSEPGAAYYRIEVE